MSYIQFYVAPSSINWHPYRKVTYLLSLESCFSRLSYFPCQRKMHSVEHDAIFATDVSYASNLLETKLLQIVDEMYQPFVCKC